jgi:two-component SAPR family response regulator
MELDISKTEFNYLILQLEGLLISHDLNGNEQKFKELSEVLDKIRKRTSVIKKYHKILKKRSKEKFKE